MVCALKHKDSGKRLVNKREDGSTEGKFVQVICSGKSDLVGCACIKATQGTIIREMHSSGVICR